MLLKIIAGKVSAHIHFIFHIQIFFLVNFGYIANVLIKIWGMQVFCLIVVQMLFWNRYNQDSARRVYFNISREKPAHIPDTLHFHPLSCKFKWTNQKHFYCFLLKPVRDNLVPGFPRALTPWPSCAEELWGRE